MDPQLAGVVAGDGGWSSAKAQLQALTLQRLGQVLAHFLVKAAQQERAAGHQRDLAAQGMEDTGKLDRDIAATDDDDALRQLGQAKRFVRRNRQLSSGNVEQRGCAASRNQDVPRC